MNDHVQHDYDCGGSDLDGCALNAHLNDCDHVSPLETVNGNGNAGVNALGSVCWISAHWWSLTRSVRYSVLDRDHDGYDDRTR